MWRLWSYALGEKHGKNDKEADIISIIRTVIFASYLITNCFIVAGVIKNWNKSEQIYIEIDPEILNNHKLKLNENIPAI